MLERTLIGRESEPVLHEVEKGQIRRFAEALGDPSPLAQDEAAARAAGYPGLAAPPTFVQYALVEGRPLAETRTDGLFQGDIPIRLAVQRTMFGGEEWDFLAPVVVGDVITAETRLAALDQKDGSKGPFVRITRETTYTNQAGAVVARTRQIGIAR